MLHIFKEHFSASGRAEHSLNKYRPYFGKSVLDVGAGGSANYFRQHLGSAYKAADMSDSRNKPDYFVDFEKGQLPFKDGEFETVLSFDNLEHCENCHELFDELLRVSSKYVIISLPNNWPTLFMSMLKGRNRSHIVGYGLPAEKPAPGIRHKWFFNLEEAENFIVGRAKMKGSKIAKIDYVYEGGYNLISVPFLYPRLFRVQPNHLRRLLDVSEKDQNKFGQKAIIGNKIIKTLGMPATVGLLYFAKLFSLPFWLLDEVIKNGIWGWGSKYRYLNNFCRQVWVIVEK